jgi:hypothetical protein
MQARGFLPQQIEVEDQVEIVQDRQTNVTQLREQQSGIAIQRLTKQLQKRGGLPKQQHFTMSGHASPNGGFLFHAQCSRFF